MIKHGSFVISLDFELNWGMIDKSSVEEYGNSHVAHVPEAVMGMLTLFDKYDVKATFATVGLIMLNDKNEAVSMAPSQKPSYKNPILSPYSDGYIEKIKPENTKLYFSPELIKELKENKHIEIGTHTFCHYYCWEEGQTVEQFEQDIATAIKIGQGQGLGLTSIVFPRNQVAKPYLQICAKYGIECYRGNAIKFFEQPKNKFQRYKNRILRLLDTYLNIRNDTTISYEAIDCLERPVNVPASRFLKPYSKRFAFLKGLKFHRIKSEIKYAAKHDKLYHLWWHPHNFGDNVEKNLLDLEKILQCYDECHKKHGMQSYTMTEFASELKK